MDCRSARHVNARPRIGFAAWGSALAFPIALAILSGCDEKPPVIAPNPPTPAATQAAAMNGHPTTQELVEGKRKKMMLGAEPLSIQVPASWHLEAGVSGTTLDGPCPHGDVSINIAMQGAPLKPDSVKAMDLRSHAQAASQPSNLMVVPMRSIGGEARMMEQREFIRHMPIKRDNDQIEYVDRVDWMISIFIPNQNIFNVTTMNFAGLSLEQYQADREFLEKIVASVHFDAARARK